MDIKGLIKKSLPPSMVLGALSFKHKLWGVPELRLLKKLVKPGTDSLDIGVYMGVFSINMARYAKKVYAFEPHPKHFAFAKRALPANVEVLNLALSDTTFETELVVPVKYPSAGSLSKDFTNEQVERFKVQAKPLDSFGFDNVSCMKIDAEGHEFNIIKGGRETILRNKPNLIVEIEQRHIDIDIEEVFRSIQEMGYLGYFYQNNEVLGIDLFDKKVHQPVDLIGKYNVYINNFIFVPKDSTIDF